MADHTWPESLPCFLVRGYSRGGGDDGVLRSQFDAGSKSRPRWTAPPAEPMSAQIRCTPAQLQTLLDFWAITLRRALPFKHVDPENGAEFILRFTGRPERQPTNSGRAFYVTLPLEVISTTPGAFPLTDGGGPTLLTQADEELTT